jgi:CDP-diacylglycerol--serine O-phosphatidyltransferase
MRGRLRSRRLAGSSAGFAGAIERGSLGGGRRGPLRQKMRGRGIFLLPSLLTTGNLFCGFFALLLTVESRYFEAALAIFVAMVMDMLDGRVARLMKATSQFGVEFDSLADVVSFCVAPAFLIYSFALAGLGRPAWFAAFLFVICGALRLARFNVYTGVTDRRFFVGLSTPAGAGVLVSTVLLLYREEAPRWVLVAIAVGTYLTALLMVSTFRYWSFKEIDFARRRPAQTLLVVVLAVMIVATNHELFPFLLFGVYALSGPVRWLVMGRTTAAAHGELSTKEPS